MSRDRHAPLRALPESLVSNEDSTFRLTRFEPIERTRRGPSFDPSIEIEGALVARTCEANPFPNVIDPAAEMRANRRIRNDRLSVTAHVDRTHFRRRKALPRIQRGFDDDTKLDRRPVRGDGVDTPDRQESIGAYHGHLAERMNHGPESGPRHDRRRAAAEDTGEDLEQGSAIPAHASVYFRRPL